MPFKSLSETKGGRFLRRRSKIRGDRVSKGNGSSASDFGLSSLFRATSISAHPSDGSSGHEGKSKSESAAQSGSERQSKSKKQRFPNFGLCKDGSKKTAEEEVWRQTLRSWGMDDMSLDPVVFRAGILIVVTSPEGEDGLGFCDGEIPYTSGRRGTIKGGSRG